MINIKAVILALLLCLALPVKSAAVDANSSDKSISCWWPLLYPQLCGSGSLPEDKNIEVDIAFKITELFHKQ